MKINVSGHEIETHYSALAVSALEEHLDIGVGDLIERVRGGGIRVRDMLGVIWAGCLDALPSLTPEQLGRSLGKDLIPLGPLYQVCLGELFVAASRIVGGPEMEPDEEEPGKNV